MELEELKKLCEDEISNVKKIIMSSKTIIATESERQSIYEYVLKDLVDISSMFYFQYSTTEITDAFIANKEKYIRKLSAIKKQIKNEKNVRNDKMKNCLRCGRKLEQGDIDEGLCVDCIYEADLEYDIEHMGEE